MNFAWSLPKKLPLHLGRVGWMESISLRTSAHPQNPPDTTMHKKSLIEARAARDCNHLRIEVSSVEVGEIIGCSALNVSNAQRTLMERCT